MRGTLEERNDAYTKGKREEREAGCPPAQFSSAAAPVPLFKSDNLVESAGQPLPVVQMRLEPDECCQNTTLGACDTSVPKVTQVSSWVQRPVLFSVHPAQHLTDPGPTSLGVMPSLISLGHRVPHQH